MAFTLEKQLWTSTEIKKLYRYLDRFKSIKTLYNAEERGEIPKAERITRGKVKVRQWRLDQLPEIGKKFGFMKKPKGQKVVSYFVQKGGVWKTTTAYNTAKTAALNGIKTLVIGTDPELSITDLIFPMREETYENLDDINTAIDKLLGLYDFFCNNVPLNEIIKKTSLPTLDVIPETHSLSALEKWLSLQTRREDVFSTLLIPNLEEYELIIFDYNTAFDHLTMNGIAASGFVVSPLGCNFLAYKAVDSNIDEILDFKEKMNLYNQKNIMFASGLKRTSLSNQIYTSYLTHYREYILKKHDEQNQLVPIVIRESAQAEQALALSQTIFEYAPTSSSADEMYELVNSLWEKICSNDEEDVDDSHLHDVVQEEISEI